MVYFYRHNQYSSKFSSLYILLKAFKFPEQQAVAQHHFKELGRELNIHQENKRDEAKSEQNKPTQIEIEVWSSPEILIQYHEIKNPFFNIKISSELFKVTEITIEGNDQNKGKSIRKQVSLNDELFFTERQKEKENIKEKIRRQQSLPECHFSSEEKPKTLRESFLAVTQTKKFDIFLEGITKLRKSPAARTEERPAPAPPQADLAADKDAGVQKTSLGIGISKMLNKWKSEAEDNSGLKSFTQKRGVTIDPINVLGLRRDQSLDRSLDRSLDSATRRGLFHTAGGCSPKSPKQLSPTLRRCCMECPEDSAHSQERRMSQGGSDSSKDSSIQSDTSLDSEDSCISVIFIAKPGLTGPGSGQSQRSTSNSSGSSESPPG